MTTLTKEEMEQLEKEFTLSNVEKGPRVFIHWVLFYSENLVPRTKSERF